MTEIELFATMAKIRRFEERCLELSSEGVIAGSLHPCLGQEAIPAGAMAALGSEDRVLPTYRGHGWAIACGVPIGSLLAEICQKAEGVNGGRGGSAHLSAPEHGLLGENSIVGAGVPIGAGVGLAAKAQRSGRVALVSIGDGAMNQGATNEGLIFAAARSLPLIVVVENNGWSEMTPIERTVRVADLANRADGYGIAADIVDGNDPEAVRAAVAAAAAAARDGRGPALLECKTARLAGHYNGDIEHYRPQEDAEAARDADPLRRLRQRLIESGAADEAACAQIEADAQAAIDEATSAVRSMDAPDPSSARAHLFAPPAAPEEEGGEAGAPTELTFVKAVTAALRAELAGDETVQVFGEDVGFAGGIFGASRGLQEEFGEERVFDTPIAESAILGAAVGASLEGLRPVVEIMWGDFLLVALDQLINQAANVRYVSRSALSAPLVVRTQQGVTPGSCAQHSQSLEALLAHIPGLRVGLPATPQDAYAMLRAAVADQDPCLLFEARSLYQRKGEVRLDAAVERVGGARLRRSGSDLGIITWGTMLHQVLAATELLAEDGIEAAVLDLRWLSPLDDEAVERLVRASGGRVMVAHEANLTGGFGAEVAARIQERHFDELDGPVTRVATPDSRIPSAPALQEALLPQATEIAAAARRLRGSAVATG